MCFFFWHFFLCFFAAAAWCFFLCFFLHLVGLLGLVELLGLAGQAGVDRGGRVATLGQPAHGPGCTAGAVVHAGVEDPAGVEPVGIGVEAIAAVLDEGDDVAVRNATLSNAACSRSPA